MIFLNRRDCVICDIDDTLADRSHRIHHVQNDPKDWDAYFGGIHNDSVIYPTLIILESLFEYYGYEIVFCTGRQEKFRPQTEKWIKKTGLIYSSLMMRSTGDFREDSVIKKEMVEKLLKSNLNPTIAIDNSDEVLEMYSSQGIQSYKKVSGDYKIGFPNVN